MQARRVTHAVRDHVWSNVGQPRSHTQLLAEAQPGLLLNLPTISEWVRICDCNEAWGRCVGIEEISTQPWGSSGGCAWQRIRL